ncbi:MAG: response regulator [Candidatus Rokuibacteriota bacterium]|nr:MAG: response regulator [Candidatus Rokubacteria bacterium]
MAEPFKILIIDDDAPILEAITDLLKAAGYQAFAGLGGARGLHLARTERPDLILVDYHMPEMNGVAVAERLKADEATRRIPVVALTSSTAEDANKLLEAGCIGFIPKPFEVGTLAGLIGEFLRATVARRSGPDQYR